MSVWWLGMALLPIAQDAPHRSADSALPLALPSVLSALPKCETGLRADTIVVCGRRKNEHRLPLPSEPPPGTDPIRGELRSGMAALTPTGRCGLFAGERRCGKREAAEYGYGNGRDPVTLVARLAARAIDGDED